MRSSWILIFVVSYGTSIVSADDSIPTRNITAELSNCATSCLASLTKCSLNNILSVCNDTQLTSTIRDCVVEHCDLSDGRQFEKSLKSAFPTYTYMVPSQQRLILNITLSFSGISVFLALLRIPVQIYENQTVFAEDLFLTLAVASQTALATLYSLAAYGGLGEHMLDIDAGLRRELIYIFSATPIYWLVLLTTRLSVVLFLRRMNTARGYRICTDVMMAFIVVWGVSIIFLSIFQCEPIAYNWDMALERNLPSGTTQGSCLNLKVLAFSSNAISLFQDVSIFLLAIPLLWMLHMRVEKRFGACLILLVGLFVCAAAALRLRALIASSSITADPTWVDVPTIIWSAMETSTGIILACLLVLGDILLRLACRCLSFLDKLFTRRGEAGPRRYTSNQHYSEYIQWDMQRPASSRDNFISHNFETRSAEGTARSELRSIQSIDSLQRLEPSLKSGRPESILATTTDTREHLNRTCGEFDKHASYPRPATSAAAPKCSRRLASPTQGFFRDILWQEPIIAPPPLPPLSSQQQLYSEPLHLPRGTRSSIALNTHLGNAKALTGISGTEKTYPSALLNLTQYTIGESTDRRNLTICHRPDPKKPRILLSPFPPQPTPRSLKLPPKRIKLSIMPSLTTKPACREITLKHENENIMEMAKEMQEDWVEKKRYIRRTGSGMAIEFDGKML